MRRSGSGLNINLGPADRDITGGHHIRKILDGRKLSTGCGYNYVIGYYDWHRRFEAGPLFSGF